MGQPETKTKEIGIGSAKIIYEAIMKRFELEADRTDGLDDKASNLIGFVGIILGVVSGFGSTYLTIPGDLRLDWSSFIQLSPLVSFFFALFSLFLSFALALISLQIKEFIYVPHAFNLIYDFENSEEKDVIQALSDEYAVAIKENQGVNNDKAKRIRKAMLCLFAAFVLLSIHVLSVLAMKGR